MEQGVVKYKASDGVWCVAVCFLSCDELRGLFVFSLTRCFV